MAAKGPSDTAVSAPLSKEGLPLWEDTTAACDEEDEKINYLKGWPLRLTTAAYEVSEPDD